MCPVFWLPDKYNGRWYADGDGYNNSKINTIDHVRSKHITM